MVWQRALSRRSAVEWAARGALMLLAIALGCSSVMHSLAYVIGTADPAHAHALAPSDGRLSASLATYDLAAHPDPDPNGATARLARSALNQDPTAVKAAATLGLQAQLRGDTRLARRLFAYSQQLSRRNLQTQLWAIEDAVQRNAIPDVLNHYDIALRTSGEAPNILFPILRGALAQPQVRHSLVRTLKAQPRWSESFISYLDNGGGEPNVIAQLFLDMYHAGMALSDESIAATTKGLIDADAIEDAWHFYAVVRPGSDRKISRDPQFKANLTTPSPFDWTPINDESVSTSFQLGDSSGFFDFSVPASVGGTLLQQLQILPAGRYKIIGQSSDITQPQISKPYWQLTCNNGRELGTVSISNSAQNNGYFIGSFRVPADCPVQMLALIARPSDDISGSSGRIKWVRLSTLK